MLRTTRISSIDYFWYSGFDDFRKIQNKFEEHLPEITNPTVLDWGIGMGRISEFFKLDKNLHIYGCDIDPVNINYLHDIGYPKEDFILFKPNQAIPFPDNFFNCIYGLSVFTHLNEKLQHFYLEELKRVMAPGAIGVFSVHGFICFFTRINDGNTFSNWMKNGFFQLGDNPDINEGSTAEFKNNMYVDVLHSPVYVKNIWTKYFKIIEIVEAPNNYGHDLIVVKKL